MLQNCGAKIIYYSPPIPVCSRFQDTNVKRWWENRLVWKSRVEWRVTSVLFLLEIVFAAFPLSESLTHCWLPPVLFPGVGCDFECDVTCQACQENCQEYSLLGSNPPPLTRIASTGLETRPSTRLTSHFKKDLLLVFLKYKRSLKIIIR